MKPTETKAEAGDVFCTDCKPEMMGDIPIGRVHCCPKHAAVDALEEALKAITMIAGNLPDGTLITCGGVNEGRGRALMALQARSIARAALALTETGKDNQ